MKLISGIVHGGLPISLLVRVCFFGKLRNTHAQSGDQIEQFFGLYDLNEIRLVELVEQCPDFPRLPLIHNFHSEWLEGAPPVT